LIRYSVAAFAKASACQGSVKAKASASASTFGREAFPAMQFKACKSHFMSSKEVHDHKKHWNAPARDLPDSRRNHIITYRPSRVSPLRCEKWNYGGAIAGFML
jgi:hypothetical protein